MNNEPVKNDMNYPPAASAGGDNAYYLKGCEAVQRSPSYAACLFKIGEIEAGRDDVTMNDCSAALRSGKCQAREMRQQEALQGAALYYFPRKSPQALHLPVKVAGDFGVRITNLTDPALIPRQSAPRSDRSTPIKPVTTMDALDRELDAAANGYASAITAAVADLAPASPIVIEAKPHTGPVLQPKPLGAHTGPVPQPVPLASRPAMQPGETPLQYARRLAASRTPA